MARHADEGWCSGVTFVLCCSSVAFYHSCASYGGVQPATTDSAGGGGPSSPQHCRADFSPSIFPTILAPFPLARGCYLTFNSEFFWSASWADLKFVGGLSVVGFMLFYGQVASRNDGRQWNTGRTVITICEEWFHSTGCRREFFPRSFFVVVREILWFLESCRAERSLCTAALEIGGVALWGWWMPWRGGGVFTSLREEFWKEGRGVSA